MKKRAFVQLKHRVAFGRWPVGSVPRAFNLWSWVAAGILGLLLFTSESAEATAPPSVAGNTNQPIRRLTLHEAKEIAFQRNWDLLAAKSDVNAATALKIVAHEFPNPTLSLSSMKINVDHGSGTELGNSFWDRSYDNIAAINQLFEIAGKRSSRQASAKAGFEGAEARLADARRTLDLGVTQAYVAVLLAETNVHILRQSAASLRKEATIAATRLNAGDISRADKSQIDILADRLELDAEAAQSTAAAARVAVDVLLAESNPQGGWVPADSLESLGAVPFIRIEGAPGADRPDLRAAEAAVRKAEADLHLQKALRVPDPTVMLMYEHEPPDAANTLGFGVSLPIPLWNRNRGAILAAAAARDQAAIQADKLRSAIAGEVNKASISYAEASARLRRQRDEIQPKSADIRETISFAYSKGGASLLDLLLAERNDNDIRLATAQAMADAANAAAALKSALNLPESAEQPAASPK
jgi:cobalt-zinc-cadmium efflux system outer membrane protein